ncbi:MAG: single-stranded DNA-binding protein [Alteromonadaceae bacterium]|nr:single-stranded DNA-binding protein [Alteromonadaceae bacterium]
MGFGMFNAVVKGNSAEVKHNVLPSGDDVVEFGLAYTKKWTDKKSQEKMEKPTWLTFKAYRQTAKLFNQLAQKGTELLLWDIEPETEEWVDKNNNKQRKLVFVFNRFEVNSRGKPKDAAQAQQAQGFAPQQSQGFAPQQAQGFAPQQAQGFAPQQAQGFAPQQPQGFAPQQPQGFDPNQPQYPQ